MASIKFVDSHNKRKFVIKKSKRFLKIEETLPFRIRFINVQVPGYGIGNPAPIGIAIVGINNYIL